MKKSIIFAAGCAIIAFILSCDIVDPYGEGLGTNSTGGDTSIIVPNIDVGGGGGGGGNNNCTKPSAPGGVSASAQSSSSIRISWNSVSAATSYKIYRATSAYGTYSHIGNATTTSYTNSTLPSSTPYYYKITSVNSCGESAYSSYDYATTNSVSCTKPSAPSNVSAAAQSSSSIKISWNSVSGATYYNIYRSTSATGTYTLLTYVTSASLSYTNTGLSSSTYYYKVSAENSCGEGVQSTYASASTTGAGGGSTGMPNAVEITLTSYKENGKHDVGLWGLEADPRIWFIVKSYNSSGTLLSTNQSDTLLSLTDPSGGRWSGSKVGIVPISTSAYEVSVQVKVLDKDVSSHDDISPTQYWEYYPMSAWLNKSSSHTAGTSYDDCIVEYTVKFIQR